MITYLIKATNEIRIETKEEVDQFHTQIETEAKTEGFTLSNWSEALKTKKAQGEVIDEWYIVKYTLVFNDPKDPETPLKSIDYNMFDSFAEMNSAE